MARIWVRVRLGPMVSGNDLEVRVRVVLGLG